MLGLLVAQMALAQMNASGMDQGSPAGSQSQMDSSRPSIAITALSQADREFLEDAMQDCLASLQGSLMALKKATNAGVRNLAQHIADEHESVKQSLTAIAQAAGMTMPTSPALAQRARLFVLSLSEGAGFDKRYVDSVGVRAHEAAVDLFRRAAAEANNVDVKAFAKDALPSLQHYLDLAKTMQTSLTQVSAND